MTCIRWRVSMLMLRWAVRIIPRTVNTFSWPAGDKWADLRTVENRA